MEEPVGKALKEKPPVKSKNKKNEYFPWGIAAATVAVVAAMGKWAPREWVSYIDSASPAVFAVIATWAFIYARKQFGTSKEQADAAKEVARQARVAAILEMDKMFESAEFAEARRGFQKLYKEVETRVEQAFGHKVGEDKRVAMRDIGSKVLTEARQGTEQQYESILKLVGFFETAGMMVDREYLPFDDIHDLYAGTILRLDDLVGQYVASTSEKPGVPTGYYNYFQKLVERTKQRSNRI